jgi:hypothetical protein
MGRLHSVQPDDNEPLNYTHFDAYESEYGDIAGYNRETCEVLTNWQQTLGVHFPLSYWGTPEQAVAILGNAVWDVAIVALLDAGYDVFKGNDCIEIYPAGTEEATC